MNGIPVAIVQPNDSYQSPSTSNQWELDNNGSVEWRFTDLSQADPAGRFRIIASGTTFKVQKAATAGWATATDLSAWTQTGLQTFTATDAVTNAVTQLLTLDHESSGTPAASFGTGITLQGASATVASRFMGSIEAVWSTATDASRASDVVIYNVQGAAKTAAIRFYANGDENMNPSGVAVSTNATGGFIYMPSMAGVPSGVPSGLYTGSVPLVIDSTDGRMYLYVNAAWTTAGLGLRWDQIAAPTAALNLTMPAGNETTFAYQATSQVGLALTSSTLTTGQMLNLTLSGTSAVATSANTGSIASFISTSTGFTGSSQGLVQINSSGANTNASVVQRSLIVRTTNTGTTNTNVAGDFTASGGSTANYAIQLSGGNVNINAATTILTPSTLTINAFTLGGNLTMIGTNQALFNTSGATQVSNEGEGPHIQIFGTDSRWGIAGGRWSADGTASGIYWSKSRNTAVGSYTAVQNGDMLFRLDLAGDDGTDVQTNSLRMAGVVDGTVATDQVPTRWEVWTMTAGGALTRGVVLDKAQILYAPTYQVGGTLGTSAAGLQLTGTGTTITAGGSFTVTTLLTVSAGITASGAAISLNASSNFNTTINTGNSTGTIGIGNSLAGALTIASGAASTVTVTSANLTISTATSGTLAVTSAGVLTLTAAGASVWSNSSGTLTIGTSSAANTILWYNSSAVITLTSTTGITLATATIVAGTPQFTTGIGINVAATGSGITVGAASTNNDIWNASQGAATATLYIGNQSITTVSDMRVKPNMVAYTADAMALIRRFRPVEYDMLETFKPFGGIYDGRYVGLTAQNVFDVAPWAVNTQGGAHCVACLMGQPCDEHPAWQVKYDLLTGVLVKGIQELDIRETTAEQKIAMLEAEIIVLKERLSAAEVA